MHVGIAGMQSTIRSQYRSTNCHERGPDEPGNPPNNAAQRLAPRFIHASNNYMEEAYCDEDVGYRAGGLGMFLISLEPVSGFVA